MWVNTKNNIIGTFLRVCFTDVKEEGEEIGAGHLVMNVTCCNFKLLNDTV